MQLFTMSKWEWMIKPLAVVPLLLLNGCHVTQLEKKGGDSLSLEADLAECKSESEVAGINTYNYGAGIGSTYSSVDACMKDKGYEHRHHLPGI